MSDNWNEINRRAELVEVLNSIMERIYPVWVADTRAGELVEALEKWLDSRIENIDGGPADETTAALTESDALAVAAARVVEWTGMRAGIPRKELERMTSEGWGISPAPFQGLTYNQLLLFYYYGPNWGVITLGDGSLTPRPERDYVFP